MEFHIQLLISFHQSKHQKQMVILLYQSILVCLLLKVLEAIVALPNDIFYNTGIATYIWVLSNKKQGTEPFLDSFKTASFSFFHSLPKGGFEII